MAWALDKYYKDMYELLMGKLRSEGSRLKTAAEKSYMGRGFAGGSGWERRLAGIDRSVIEAGKDITERLALEAAERKRMEDQARAQGWARTIGTGLGMVAGSFLPIPGAGQKLGAAAGGALGGSLGSAFAGGGGAGGFMNPSESLWYQSLIDQLRLIYGLPQGTKPVSQPQTTQRQFPTPFQGPTYDPEWYKKLQGPSPYFLGYGG